MPQNKVDTIKTQSGNVFMIILIGVILFGALGFTFSRSANKGTGNLSKQQAKVAAQEILNYARLVEGAVDRVRRKGCSETEISFENNVVSGYENPNSPLDKSCHVFDDNGGKVSWNSKNSENWIVSSKNRILNLGENLLSELVIIRQNIDKNICKEINSHANVDTSGDLIAIEHDYYSLEKFIGSFPSSMPLLHGSGTPDTSAKKFACIRSTHSSPPAESTQENIFYFHFVLLAR